jgi:hypothetical protein
MEFQHVNVKVFVEGDLPFDPSRFINVFHGWIQQQVAPELLVDVADYCHVPHGPGVLLVAHEADYSMDHTDGRWGLRYNRKAPIAGSNDDRFRQALSAAASACCRLEEQFAKGNSGGSGATRPLRFSRTQFEVFVNDRALAPNTPEVFAAFRSDLQGFLSRLLGHKDFTLEGPGDPRRRVGAVVTSARPINLEGLQTVLQPKA